MEKYAAILKPMLVILFIILICASAYYGATLLIPLTYGMMFAFLVDPIDQKMQSFGTNKYLAAIVSVLTILAFVFLLLSAFGWQIQQLVEQSDQIKKELIETQEKIQSFAKNQFGISFKKQDQYAEKIVDRLQDQGKRFLGDTLGIAGNFFLALIYAILLLTEKKRIQQFVYMILKNQDKAEDAINETAKVIQKYLGGKLIIITILATVYAIGFLLVGIQYAVLIAVLAAFLSFIPYAGNIIGGFLAALITMATGGSMTDILIIFSVMAIAQVIESYILEPWIVGSNIDLNPLFSILAVIAMSTIWGAAGAIIALPLIGILKVIFDHFKAYQALGFLMDNSELKE